MAPPRQRLRIINDISVGKFLCRKDLGRSVLITSPVTQHLRKLLPEHIESILATNDYRRIRRFIGLS